MGITYFGRKFGVMVFKDSPTGQILYKQYVKQETNNLHLLGVENPNLQPDLEGNDYILERQLKPEARKDLPLIFEGQEILPTAMIDISDGLASEILHICTQSEVGCNL